MRRLAGLTREDGAVAVMVALMLVSLLGIVALVIDVGMMYWEVRQLQNGADAAALAIAQDCADGNDCESDADAVAITFAGSNANDGAARAEVEFDAHGPDTVTVTAFTDDNAGSGRLPSFFARVLGVDSTTFARSATAMWGPASLGPSIPLTISQCEWDIATNAGTTLPSAPIVIQIKGNPGANTCAIAGSPGHYQPGGFGWLDPTRDGCEAEVYHDGVPGNTGSRPPSPDCNHNQPGVDWPGLVGQTVMIPIHHTATAPGNNTKYDMLALGAFHITSLKVGGGPEYLGGTGVCPGTGDNQRCLIGYFVKKTDIGGVVDPDGEDLGVRVAQLIG
jgi:hypothetical protein